MYPTRKKSLQADAFRGARLQPLPSLRSVQGLQLALIPQESPPSALPSRNHGDKSLVAVFIISTQLDLLENYSINYFTIDLTYLRYGANQWRLPRESETAETLQERSDEAAWRSPAGKRSWFVEYQHN
ncbi:hypothetical protein BBH88_01950 [Planococcus antarcticus DSM 14505]|uniref:Uncharacterized protein n=1 Tax=Planococcus antarcticus DSM 14505 TaxID=1185653 RepID=A0ABM6D1S0_9BACL|nr:hypothetical protein BBH88_01950 [Planococcus antarcticus DSM 14505]